MAVGNVGQVQEDELLNVVIERALDIHKDMVRAEVS